MKIKKTISNDLDFNKCYLGHNPEYSRGLAIEQTPCVMLMSAVL